MAEETGPVTPAGASPEGASASSSEATGDILYLGVDLGTANSSIATSTDITRTVPSVVGWPKDLVAYKFLQKPIVYGEESIRNRMTLDLYYPLEKGVLIKIQSRSLTCLINLCSSSFERALLSMISNIFFLPYQ